MDSLITGNYGPESFSCSACVFLTNGGHVRIVGFLILNLSQSEHYVNATFLFGFL